ncbi:MAG: DnaJ domain-containing protein [Gammaproteobacteria bacterium]|nr:DnaJ domain-containing protein [Gammaproteobacteria bacterium]
MQNKRNFYRLLHVQFDAPDAVIKASYRSMMQKLKMHPDLGGDEATAKLLNEALETLLDPQKRARYDKSLSERPFRGKDTSGQVRADSPAPSAADERKQNNPATAQNCLICGSPYFPASADNSVWQIEDRCRCCSSPLRAPDAFRTSDAAELRQLDRMACRAETAVRATWPDGRFIAVELLDFSLRGVGLRVPEALAAGQVVYVKSRIFDAVAVVAHCHEEAGGKWTAGLQFHTLHLQSQPGDLLEVSC